MATGPEEAALGTVCWWGLTPALDLRQHLPLDLDPAAEAPVLLVGAAEGRHLLVTAARARRGPPRTITLFVAEQRPEAVARQLLFLLLAAEAPGRAGLEGTAGPPGHHPTRCHRDLPPAPLLTPTARAATILELFGSVRLSAGTAALLARAAAHLRRWV
ncbi:DAAF3 factor, partial [Eubucco bourcierii]|nr:DAAF3 factor [Eubucco bourcierii]